MASLVSAIFVISVVAVSAAVYLLPTLIGWARHVPHIGSVAAINILLGWTLAGWASPSPWRCVPPAVPWSRSSTSPSRPQPDRTRSRLPRPGPSGRPLRPHRRSCWTGGPSHLSRVPGMTGPPADTDQVADAGVGRRGPGSRRRRGQANPCIRARRVGDQSVPAMFRRPLGGEFRWCARGGNMPRPSPS